MSRLIRKELPDFQVFKVAACFNSGKIIRGETSNQASPLIVIVTGKENYLPCGASGAGAGAGAPGASGAGAGAGVGAGASTGFGASSFFWQPTVSARERTINIVSIIAINFFIILNTSFRFRDFNLIYL